LASRGSVVENFAHQIARGGPVTVTHPEARRYFLALEESVELLLSAACEGGSGVAGASLLTPVLHQTHLVGDLAAFMVSELSPNLSIPVVYSGLRPGEKLEEELWSVEEFPAAATGNGLRKVETPQPSRAELDAGLREMRAAIEGRDVADAIGLLRGLVPNYSPSKSVMKLVRQSRDKAPA
jgi:O-antigen biosynthesis protein WbqV